MRLIIPSRKINKQIYTCMYVCIIYFGLLRSMYVCMYKFYLNKSFKFLILLKEIIVIIKTHNKLIMNIFYFLNFIVDNLFSLKIKQFHKVIFITLFLQIYYFLIFDVFDWYYSFTKWSYSSNYFFMHYIFVIYFSTIKIFKF